jgi:type IV secretion system protein VirD4
MPRSVPRPPLPSKAAHLISLVVAATCGVHAGVQYMAYMTGFHPVLGEPAFDLSGFGEGVLPWRFGLWLPLAGGMLLAAAASLLWEKARPYAPVGLAGAFLSFELSLGPIYGLQHYLGWMRLFLEEEALRPVAEQAMVVTTGGFISAILLLLGALKGSFRLRETTSQGSAHWGGARPLENKTGLILGKSGRRLLRFDGEGHLLTLAPTRSGKGTGPVISNLLTYPGSVVVTDPKGENYWVTAAQRQALGQRVVALDPFGVVGGTGAYNPLDIIDTSSERSIDYARMLAEMIVVSRGSDDSSNSKFFQTEARAIVSGLILYVAHAKSGRDRHLGTVRELLTLAPEPFEALLEEMKVTTGCFGLISRTAARILQKEDRERSGAISTAQSHTHFLDSPSVRRRLRWSTFQMEDLKRERLTLYIIVPMDQLDAYAGFVRLIIASCWMGMIRETRRPEENVLFLLDEFANLGKMEMIGRAITLLAGYAATIWMIVQNLGQLEVEYGRGWKSLLDVAVLQTFATGDQETAEYVSKMTGEATVFTGSQAESRSRGKGGRGRQRSFNMSERSRRLLTPDEVRRLPASRQLIFLKGESPIQTDLLRYYEEKGLSALAEPNPLYEGTVEDRFRPERPQEHPRSDEDSLEGQESWSVPESGEQMEEVEAKRGEETTEVAAEEPGPEASSESGDLSPMGEEPVVDDYFLPFALREEAPSSESSSEGKSERE